MWGTAFLEEPKVETTERTLTFGLGRRLINKTADPRATVVGVTEAVARSAGPIVAQLTITVALSLLNRSGRDVNVTQVRQLRRGVISAFTTGLEQQGRASTSNRH